MNNYPIAVGSCVETNNSGLCEVVEYKNSHNILVRFKDGTRVQCQKHQLLIGKVKNPNTPMVYSTGYIGQGVYSSSTHLVLYRTWSDMLRRCYSDESLEKYPTYKGCLVDVRWNSFQNFCIDYLQMTGHLLNWVLDKDILVKGNKLYSKETCCLVPVAINSLIIKANSQRGNLPIGVTFSNRKNNPYKAHCRINNTGTDLGNFKTPESAFQAYKQAKESEIKRVARFYRFQLDPKVFNALLKYEVEIND